MDSFKMCRLASEKACWSFDEELHDLKFNFERPFLPQAMCGSRLPDSLSPEIQTQLNHIRGFSYSHIFQFVEEFIIPQVCTAAGQHIHEDLEAVSALLKFTDEETKHQRMFELAKDLIAEGLGFRPSELPNKEQVAKDLNTHSSFALFMLTLALEWLTQRHYVECFQQVEDKLDPGFVKLFRLHWIEEAQHARLDALELRELAEKMSPEEIAVSITEFRAILLSMKGLLEEQDRLDLASLEQSLGERFPDTQRKELLDALHQDFLWTFLISGLEHKSFVALHDEIVPEALGRASDYPALLRG